ncbi:MAG: SDR family NAD(P)-dependent oxidoreductase [Pseudomonadota bacterium]
MKIQGTRAIVTGGASGLGAATVAALSERGAGVAIFDIEKEKGRKLASQTGATFYCVDVTDEANVAQAMDDFCADGDVHILVNCAGIAPAMKLFIHEGLHRLDVFERVQAVNSTGTFISNLQFASRPREPMNAGEECGVIINTSSIAAQDGQMGHIAYAASKAAVEAMTLPMARELAGSKIRVVTVAPGLFDTGMAEFSHVQRPDNPGQQVPHPARLGEAEEFASLVLHVIENPMINGCTLRIDGALRLGLL